MKHTPGPWTAATYPHKGLGGFYAIECGDENADWVAQGIYKSHNAHLIAAAPELLEALIGVLIASEDGGDMNDIDWTGIRAAVAKAEGDK